MAPLVARYVDCAREAGINFTATNARSPRKYLIETMGSGCGFIDYDRDGFLDILLLNGRPLPGTPVTGHPTLKLYHNNGNGTFTDVTHKAGLDIPMFAMGCAAGDYDNDGYDDIYISCALGDGHLFHNDGNGHFTDVTRRAGVGDGGRWGTSCAWVDVDSDGYLDLFVCNYV
ncbi:MAG TPA: VCBS repeat-containing protein, partial [Chthonomonadales bacterium]|nr:VCBS repeat-containing protein [Chthonomonadales bacterium]